MVGNDTAEPWIWRGEPYLGRGEEQPGQCGSSVCSGQGDHRQVSFGSISERVNSTGGASCMETTARFNPRNVLRLAGVIKDLPTSEMRWQAWGSRCARGRRAAQRPVGRHAERDWPKVLLLGEHQQLVFVRLLLAQPCFAMLICSSSSEFRAGSRGETPRRGAATVFGSLRQAARGGREAKQAV